MYKRQATDLGKTNDVGIKNVYNFYIDCKVKDIKYKRLIRELIEDDLVNNFKGMADYYIAVSYTHLDVYKRQNYINSYK